MNATPSSRREWLAILVVTGIGGLLRIQGIDRLGLTHFDEGIYAMAGLWPFQAHGLADLNPSTMVYAPPGLAILIGLSYQWLGVSDLSAIAVSIAAGFLTIPLLGWLGRRAFGPGAGVAAASLGAISGAHVAFSRVALTDATFLLAWLFALTLGGRFLERPGFGRALALGLAVGISQNFKYNGWLAGVIVVLAAISGLRPNRDGIRLLIFLTLAGSVAAVCYVPWYRFVSAQPGGYPGLLRHHAGYMKGVDAWLPHWKTQMNQAVALSGGPVWGMAGWGLAWMGAWLATGPIAVRRSRGLVALVVLILVGAILGLVPNLPWWLSLAAMPWLLRDHRPGVRVVACSWISLAILTPFYHPYARLWLPSTAASWLIVAGMTAEGCRWLREGDRVWTRLRIELAARGLIAAVVISLVSSARPHDRLLGPSDGVRSALGLIHRAAGEKVPLIILLGRPPVIFYEMIRGNPVARVEDSPALERANLPGIAIVEESQLRQEGDPESLIRRLGARFKLDAVYPEIVSIPTLLDEDPDAPFDRSSGLKSRLWIFRSRWKGSSP